LTLKNNNSNLFVCERCGNPYLRERGICPYCSATPKGKKRSIKIKTENIEKNFPTVDEALRLATARISAAKSDGTKVIKIIHGYGSSGKGGKIRIAIRKSLNRKKKSGIIEEWIPGEDFATINEKTQQMIKKYPKLKSDPYINKRNQGISIVIIS